MCDIVIKWSRYLFMNLFFIYEIIIDQQILSFITLFYIILMGVDTYEITGSDGYIHSGKLYVIHLMFYFWNHLDFLIIL